MSKLFTNIECLDIINQTENLNNWSHHQSDNLYSYRACNVDLNDTYKNKIKTYCIDVLNLDLKNVKSLILKYLPSDFFAKHVDNNIHSEFNRDFMFNLNMRLNDDYIGGDFYLDDTKLKKPIGTLYHYSSDTPHEVTPMVSGIRYSVLFYIRTRDLNHKISLI